MSTVSLSILLLLFMAFSTSSFDVVQGFGVKFSNSGVLAPSLSSVTSSSPVSSIEGVRQNSGRPFFALATSTTTTPPSPNHSTLERAPPSTIQQGTTRKRWCKPRIDSIDTEKEFKDFLLEDDRLVIVNFYAPWCKTCQKFARDFTSIGKQVGDLEEISGTYNDDDDEIEDEDDEPTLVRPGVLRMARIEFGRNTDLCKSLGVTKFPSVQIYSRGRLIDAFSCGPKKMPVLLEKLERYLSMSPAELEFEAAMFDGVALGESVLEALAVSQEMEATVSVAI